MNQIEVNPLQALSHVFEHTPIKSFREEKFSPGDGMSAHERQRLTGNWPTKYISVRV